MKATFVTFLVAGAILAGSAYAASFTAMEILRYKVHGKMVEIHAMKMDDGSMMYAVSKDDLLRMLNRRSLEQGHTAN